MSTMRSIRLYGHLREHCGRTVVRLAVATVVEAIQALEANFPGFAAKLREGSYRLLTGKKSEGRDLSEESVKGRYKLTSESLHILPITKGAKNFMQVILGVVLIAAAFIFAPAAGAGAGVLGADLGASALFGLTTFGNLALLGGAMALSGLITPKTDFSQREKADNRSTFFSNGAVNQDQEGACVPLVYGEPIIGSVVVSVGIEAEDVAITS